MSKSAPKVLYRYDNGYGPFVTHEAPHPDMNPERVPAVYDLRQGDRDPAEIAQESLRLRAALANSDQPCAYCTLPADEWAKCQHGFPGCARMDDASGCPEFGAAMNLAQHQAEYDRHRKANEQAAKLFNELLAESYIEGTGYDVEMGVWLVYHAGAPSDSDKDDEGLP